MYQKLIHKNVRHFLDNRLLLEEHLKMKLNKIIKTIGLLRKLHNNLPRSALLTMYKGFLTPHLDYGNIIYNQTYNATFSSKIGTDIA